MPDVCLKCGSVLSGTPGSIVRKDDLKRLWLTHYIGAQRVTGTAFSLPAWDDPVLGKPPQVSNTLFQGWKKMGIGAVRGQLESKLAVSHGRRVATRQLPNLPRVSYDSKIVGHMLESPDDEHIMYAPLLPRTLNEPDSAWNTVYKGIPEQLLYLKRYLVGSRTITHLVVVDSPGEFIRSAYQITRKPPETYRFGIFQYSAWGFAQSH